MDRKIIKRKLDSAQRGVQRYAAEVQSLTVRLRDARKALHFSEGLAKAYGKMLDADDEQHPPA